MPQRHLTQHRLLGRTLGVFAFLATVYALGPGVAAWLLLAAFLLAGGSELLETAQGARSMNHPKVYDAKGRVLEEGSRVNWHGSVAEGLVHEVTVVEGVHEVVVDFAADHGTLTIRTSSSRLPSLSLITDDEKGDGDG
jgi:hypothetical protein